MWVNLWNNFWTTIVLDMDSIPPARPHSISPVLILLAMSEMAINPEEHNLLMARSCSVRNTCSQTSTSVFGGTSGLVQNVTNSNIFNQRCIDSSLLINSFKNSVKMNSDCTDLKDPLKPLPMAVLYAATMTTSSGFFE